MNDLPQNKSESQLDAERIVDDRVRRYLNKHKAKVRNFWIGLLILDVGALSGAAWGGYQFIKATAANSAEERFSLDLKSNFTESTVARIAKKHANEAVEDQIERAEKTFDSASDVVHHILLGSIDHIIDVAKKQTQPTIEQVTEFRIEIENGLDLARNDMQMMEDQISATSNNVQAKIMASEQSEEAVKDSLEEIHRLQAKAESEIYAVLEGIRDSAQQLASVKSRLTKLKGDGSDAIIQLLDRLSEAAENGDELNLLLGLEQDLTAVNSDIDQIKQKLDASEDHRSLLDKTLSSIQSKRAPQIRGGSHRWAGSGEIRSRLDSLGSPGKYDLPVSFNPPFDRDVDIQIIAMVSEVRADARYLDPQATRMHFAVWPKKGTVSRTGCILELYVNEKLRWPTGTVSWVAWTQGQSEPRSN